MNNRPAVFMVLGSGEQYPLEPRTEKSYIVNAKSRSRVGANSNCREADRVEVGIPESQLLNICSFLPDRLGTLLGERQSSDMVAIPVEV
jgi:hypothetical protein